MSPEYFIIGVLTVLMIAQNVFWARVCLNLTNRIMSRNYAELKQAEHKPAAPVLPLKDDEHDPVAERQATELNAMFGMV